MHAIELSYRYYKEYGEGLLAAFPALTDKVAVGVFGFGSECFGYEDETSLDHDVDPGFFLFLSGEDYREWEFRLSRAYDKLPRVFEGMALLGMSAYGNARHGVRETGAFFSAFTGLPRLPEMNGEWLRIPDHALAAATNGRVFFDGKGEVTAMRKALSSPPEDVWRKRLARDLALAAQSGQYNYARALAHGEKGAAALALSEFAKHVAGAVCRLNGVWPPFYKWVFRRARELPVLGETALAAQTLLLSPLAPDVPEKIEAVAADLIEELKKRGLSDLPFDFLEPHALEVQKGISDPALRNAHVME